MSRWVVGDVRSTPTDIVLALDVADQDRARQSGAAAVPFDVVAACNSCVDREHILIRPPKWRGLRFSEFLEWLVCARLGVPGETRATWLLHKREGKSAISDMLRRRGWNLERSRCDGSPVLEGVVPPAGPRPGARQFTADILDASCRFAADWGVFSPEHLDNGTLLLISAATDVVGTSPTNETVVDVGTGYGAIAIAVAKCRAVREVIASEIDYVAAYLARENAKANGVDLVLTPEADPSRLPASAVTTCEFPTHVDADARNLLVRGLTTRARAGVVLVAIHKRIMRPYQRLFEEAGAASKVGWKNESHVVLRLSPKPAG